MIDALPRAVMDLTTAASELPGSGMSAVTIPAATSTLSLSMEASLLSTCGSGTEAISLRSSRGTADPPNIPFEAVTANSMPRPRKISHTVESVLQP